MPARGFVARSVVCLSAVVVTLAAAGCTTQSALTRREVVVQFSRDATPQQHASARAACTGFRHTSPEPLSSAGNAAARMNDVRFRVDLASDAELNALYKCLIRQPGVIGVNIPAVQ